mmetsp:Transcript_37846/g.87465  ORF Transcript_37846/g.87465 Transcript_37846/m.87465 type:complete len:111 (+) Transcript_37846:350-682(+)
MTKPRARDKSNKQHKDPKHMLKLQRWQKDQRCDPCDCSKGQTHDGALINASTTRTQCGDNLDNHSHHDDTNRVSLMAPLSENGIPVCCNATTCKLQLMSMYNTMATAKTH